MEMGKEERDYSVYAAVMRDNVPVSMDVRGTEGEAVVHQWRVDGNAAFSVVQQLVQVEQMSLTATDTIPGTVLVKHEHLARVEPALHRHNTASIIIIINSRRRRRPSSDKQFMFFASIY